MSRITQKVNYAIAKDTTSYSIFIAELLLDLDEAVITSNPRSFYDTIISQSVQRFSELGFPINMTAIPQCDIIAAIVSSS